MAIGHRIKERRKYLKMSAEELAKRLGKDRSTVYRYEKGDIENLPLDILEPIAQALETTPQFLMGWDGEKEKPTAQSDELSEEMKELIEAIKKLPDDKVQMLLQVARSIR